MEDSAEKNYLERLIKELKKFLTSGENEKIEIAKDFSTSWTIDEDNNEISDRTKEISSNLIILEHYEEDPEGYVYLAKSLLEESEEQLKVISPEEESEKREIEENDEAEKELEDEEDNDYQEKFIVG